MVSDSDTGHQRPGEDSREQGTDSKPTGSRGCSAGKGRLGGLSSSPVTHSFSTSLSRALHATGTGSVLETWCPYRKMALAPRTVCLWRETHF